jgi:hypothetical protein
MAATFSERDATPPNIARRAKRIQTKNLKTRRWNMNSEKEKPVNKVRYISVGAIAALTFCLLQPLGAASITITFNDLGPAPPYVTVTGAPADIGRATFAGTGCVGETCIVTLTAPGNYVTGTGIGIGGSENIYEPGGLTLSDTYQETLRTDARSFTLTFISGATSALLSSGTIQETGSVQALDDLQWGGTGTGPPPGPNITDHVLFGSEVPEPSTGLLMLVGVALVGIPSYALGHRRKDRKGVPRAIWSQRSFAALTR